MPSARIELVADTANYRGAPEARSRHLRPRRSRRPARRRFSAGRRISWRRSRSTARRSSTAARSRGRIAVAERASTSFLGMNQFAPKSKTQPHPIFGDRRVRRALSMAVDRVAMLQNVFGRPGASAHGPFPMTVAYARQHDPPPALRHDGREGAARLRRAGASARTECAPKNGRPLAFLACSCRRPALRARSTRCCSRSSSARSARKPTSMRLDRQRTSFAARVLPAISTPML